MAKVDFRIERSSLQDLPERTEKILTAWQTSVRDKFAAYFQRVADEQIHITGPVILTLQQFKLIAKSSSFDREVRGHLAATVDVAQKSESITCIRNYNPKMRGSKLSGESGNRWVEIFRDVVSGDRATTALTDELFAKDPFFSLLNVTILEKLDTLLGRDSASVVNRWRIAQVFVWLATALASVAMFLQASDQTTGQRLLLGLIAAFVANLVAYAIAASCMSASFFENYGAGQRAMRLIGSSNGREAQTKIRIVTALVIFSLALAGYATFQLFSSH